ncbi:MAG: ankyrin repeat domain-containing protein [Balneolaceae bacterium]
MIFITACDNDTLKKEEETSIPKKNTEFAQLTSDDLREASLHGQSDIVDVAISQRVDIHEPNELGRTALMYASFNNHTDIVLTLLDMGQT